MLPLYPLGLSPGLRGVQCWAFVRRTIEGNAGHAGSGSSRLAAGIEQSRRYTSGSSSGGTPQSSEGNVEDVNKTDSSSGSDVSSTMDQDDKIPSANDHARHDTTAVSSTNSSRLKKRNPTSSKPYTKTSASMQYGNLHSIDRNIGKTAGTANGKTKHISGSRYRANAGSTFVTNYSRSVLEGKHLNEEAYKIVELIRRNSEKAAPGNVPSQEKYILVGGSKTAAETITTENVARLAKGINVGDENDFLKSRELAFKELEDMAKVEGIELKSKHDLEQYCLKKCLFNLVQDIEFHNSRQEYNSMDINEVIRKLQYLRYVHIPSRHAEYPCRLEQALLIQFDLKDTLSANPQLFNILLNIYSQMEFERRSLKLTHSKLNHYFLTGTVSKLIEKSVDIYSQYHPDIINRSSGLGSATRYSIWEATSSALHHYETSFNTNPQHERFKWSQVEGAERLDNELSLGQNYSLNHTDHIYTLLSYMLENSIPLASYSLKNVFKFMSQCTIVEPGVETKPFTQLAVHFYLAVRSQARRAHSELLLRYLSDCLIHGSKNPNTRTKMFASVANDIGNFDKRSIPSQELEMYPLITEKNSKANVRTRAALRATPLYLEMETKFTTDITTLDEAYAHLNATLPQLILSIPVIADKSSRETVEKVATDILASVVGSIMEVFIDSRGDGYTKAYQLFLDVKQYLASTTIADSKLTFQKCITPQQFQKKISGMGLLKKIARYDVFYTEVDDIKLETTYLTTREKSMDLRCWTKRIPKDNKLSIANSILFDTTTLTESNEITNDRFDRNMFEDIFVTRGEQSLWMLKTCITDIDLLSRTNVARRILDMIPMYKLDVRTLITLSFLSRLDVDMSTRLIGFNRLLWKCTERSYNPVLKNYIVWSLFEMDIIDGINAYINLSKQDIQGAQMSERTRANGMLTLKNVIGISYMKLLPRHPAFNPTKSSCSQIEYSPEQFQVLISVFDHMFADNPAFEAFTTASIYDLKHHIKWDIRNNRNKITKEELAQHLFTAIQRKGQGSFIRRARKLLMDVSSKELILPPAVDKEVSHRSLKEINAIGSKLVAMTYYPQKYTFDEVVEFYLKFFVEEQLPIRFNQLHLIFMALGTTAEPTLASSESNVKQDSTYQLSLDSISTQTTPISPEGFALIERFLDVVVQNDTSRHRKRSQEAIYGACNAICHGYTVASSPTTAPGQFTLESKLRLLDSAARTAVYVSQVALTLAEEASVNGTLLMGENEGRDGDADASLYYNPQIQRRRWAALERRVPIGLSYISEPESTGDEIGMRAHVAAVRVRAAILRCSRITGVQTQQ